MSWWFTQNGGRNFGAITWKQGDGICARLNRLNPYDQTVVADILKVEDCNFDRRSNQHQLFGVAVSAKRYVVYKRKRRNIEIIKPSEHGLGIVYVPDKRPAISRSIAKIKRPIIRDGSLRLGSGF
jgi:hypothetical protein